jgi:predicted nuclease of predicted toxin-antitoxin system
MNLSPDWVAVLETAGFEAAHWSTTGRPQAADAEIMDWARARDWIVFTHDLDFGALLAHTQMAKPSVFQVRTQDVTPHALSSKVIMTLRQFEAALTEGAIIVLDEHRSRIRILPLN